MTSFSKPEKIELWSSFVSMTRVRELLLSEIEAEILKKDTLSGCTTENFLVRQGEVIGLKLAKSLLERKPNEL
jgi:hypothetical protein